MLVIVLSFTSILVSVVSSKENCEVCVKVLSDVLETIPPEDRSSVDKIDQAIRSQCAEKKGKENKLCFYIGASLESATSIMNEVTKPLSWRMPPAKVCEKLSSKDSQICELKYDRAIDWKTVELRKLRVKELKKILEDWGEECKGCTEKTEYVSRIEELKSKYVKVEL